MDAGFEWRLKSALDRVNPPASSPRYASTPMGGARAWPVAPALVAAGAAVLLAITASVFTGSANPIVWAERAGSTIQSVSHSPEQSPSPEPMHGAPAAPAAQVPQQPGENEHKDALEPKEAPEPKETPEPAERPEPAESSIRQSEDH